MEFYRISWDAVMQMSIELARMLHGKRIFGMARGGLVVTSLMSFYHECTLAGGYEDADWVVDDVACTGKTLAEVKRVPTAALITRHSCEHLPTQTIITLYTDDYILFPWEDEKVIEEHFAQGSGFRSRDS